MRRLHISSVIGALALALGCGGGVAPLPVASAPRHAAVFSGTERAPEAMADEAGPARASDRAALLTCRGRSPCRVVQLLDAGHDADGVSLSVVKLALFNGEGVGEDPEKRQAGACDAYEYWSLSDRGEIGVARELTAYCNDGYGASGVGEDTVEVAENRFQHTQYGGSAWRWQATLSLSLSPLRPRYLESTSYWNAGSNFSRSRWSWDDFGGREAWYTPPCSDQAPPQDEDLDVGGDLDAPPSYAYAFETIPAVSLDAAYVKDFGGVALGACSLEIDSAASRGFVLEGAAGDAADASLKVVADASGKRLFVELRDDTFVAAAEATRQQADHLSLWLSEGAPPARDGACLEPGPNRLVEWSIDLKGAVHAASGQPRLAPPHVEVRNGSDGGKRFLIEETEAARALTVAYTDVDGPNEPERVLATSKLRVSDPQSLGALYAVAATDAECRVSGRTLAPRLRLAYEFHE